MNRSHNKKRNIGLIFEQLIQASSESLIQSNNKKTKAVLGIINKHFRVGTELYKEFRLFNALVRTRVSNPALAARIVSEAKSASIEFDSHELTKQKSKLIKDINHKLNEENFYGRRIENYRDYATIQTLLNDLRTKKYDISRVVKYEDEVCKRLISKAAIVPDVNLSKTCNDDNADPLVIKIMINKFNDKYSTSLTDEQSSIIREHVFKSNSSSEFEAILSDLRDRSIKDLGRYVSESKNNILIEKVGGVISKIKSIDLNAINDDVITKILTVSRLRHVLLEK